MKKVLALVVVLMLALTLFGCTNGGATQNPETPEEVTAPAPAKLDRPLNIAFVPVVMNTHYDMVLSGLKEEIEKNGGDKFAILNVYAPSSNEKSYEEQITIFETLLQQEDLDVLILSTEQEEATMPYMRQFCEKGVYIFYDNMTELKPDNNYYVSSITYDQYEASYLIGEWAKEYFKDYDKVNIAVLEGTPGDLNTTRMNGFHDSVDGVENFEIVASQCAYWTRSDGQSVTENLLVSNPEINFIYGTYDEMALGALAACKAAGRDDIVIAGFDNTRDAYDSILAGELTATVDTAGKEQGPNLINAIIEYCLKGNTIDKQINSKLVVYDVNTITTFNTDNYIYVPQKQIYNWD